MTHRSISSEQLIEISEKYLFGKNSHELALEYGCSNVTILNWLHKNNVSVRSGHECKLFGKQNDDSFDEINENSAYWIGYILADGCIHLKYRRWNELSITSNDIEHIDKFRSFIKSQKQICKNKNGSNTLYVRSPKMIQRLFEYGISYRKSLTATVHVDLAHNRHFWRGVTDGDGCLSFYKNYAIYNLVGSEDTINKFYIFSNGITSYKSVPRKTGKVWQITINGSPALDIIQELYKDSNISLDRKLIRAKEYCYGKRDLGTCSMRCNV